jgi:protocatechuate 3,4-dioxygenase beta subunit
VTAEGWFKFRCFDYFHTVFNFAASTFEFHALQADWTSTLVCARVVRDTNAVAPHLVILAAPGLLRLNEWCHVAVVAGTNSLKLYFNGVLVQRETEANTGRFKPAKDLERRNYLGRNNLAATPGLKIWNPDFDGQMDEVRVWRGERTEEQIRDGMFNELTGKEPGLVGLWNFNDGTANDSTPNPHHGKLSGKVSFVEARHPGSAANQPVPPTVLFGTVTDEQGKPANNVRVRFIQQDKLLAESTSSVARWLVTGPSFLAVRAAPGALDLQATSGDLGAWALGVSVAPGQRQEFNLTLAKAALLNVTVTAFDQTPLRDIVVQAVRAEAPPREPGQLATPGLADTVLTDVSGKARFLNLRPGKYRVRLHLPDVHLDYHSGEAVTVASGQPPAEVAFTIAPIHKGQWRRYTSAQGLPSDHVTDLHVAADGIVWMATAEGVASFDGREFMRFSTEQGLLHNRVFCIQATADGALWFGTELGASRFEPATERFQNFPSGKDGLTAGRVIDMEVTPDGVLAAHARGLTVRWPDVSGATGRSTYSRRLETGSLQKQGTGRGSRGQIWVATTSEAFGGSRGPIWSRSTSKMGWPRRTSTRSRSRRTVRFGFRMPSKGQIPT